MQLFRIGTLMVLLFAVLTTASVQAQSYTGRESFTLGDLVSGEVAGYDLILFGDGDTLSETGHPCLPCCFIDVALPTGAVVTGVELVEGPLVEVDGNFRIMPCARPRRISNPAQGNPWIEDVAIYKSNALFPGRMIERVADWDLAGQSFVTLRLMPLQYNPVTQKAYLATSIGYRVVYTIDPSVSPRTANFSAHTKAKLEKTLQHRAVNPEDVIVLDWNRQPSRALTPESHEHVIITTTSFEHEFDTLVDFYKKAGLGSTAVTTDWIYSNYSGGDNPEKIRNFVIDAQATWGTLYVLIGGDSSKVPYHIDNIKGDNIPNDTYYSDFDDDWKCEVYVGRAPVDSTSEIATFLTKTMDYMLDPPTGFGDEVFMMGFDYDSITPAEMLMKFIINSWMPSWADLSTEYDSESGGHESDVKNYINAGQNLTNHADHCNWNVIGVGDGSIDISECRAFYNGERRGFFSSTGCWPGAYDYNDCWGEEWIKNSNGGGIAFVGNSRYGWYMPGNPLKYSGLYNRKYFKMIWEPSYNHYFAGEALGESKSTTPPDSGTKQYTFEELNLQGDPALPLWTDVPGTMTCSFDATLDPGLQCYMVNVQSGGSDLEGARVCLWKGDQVYESAVTNSTGSAGLIINPLDAGTMNVTVTAQNQIPYFGSASVQSGTLPDLAVAIALDDEVYYPLDYINYEVVVANSTSSSQTTTMWTNVTVPNMNIWPSSGYLDGPTSLSIPAGGSETLSFSQRIPQGPPIGNFVFNVFVGPNPGVEDEDHWTFSVANP